MAVRFDTLGEHYTSSLGAVGTTFSAVCWAYLAVDRGSYSGILSFESDATAPGTAYLEIGIDPSAILRVFTNTGDIDTTMTFPVGTWYRLGVVIEGSVGTFYYGTDNSLYVSTATGISNGGRSFFFIGADFTSGEWWNGRIAGVKVWSTALSKAEIEAEFGSYDPVQSTGILRVHKLLVPETTDYSGNGWTLSGGTGTTTEADPPVGTDVPEDARNSRAYRVMNRGRARG